MAKQDCKCKYKMEEKKREREIKTQLKKVTWCQKSQLCYITHVL